VIVISVAVPIIDVAWCHCCCCSHAGFPLRLTNDFDFNFFPLFATNYSSNKVFDDREREGKPLCYNFPLIPQYVGRVVGSVEKLVFYQRKLINSKLHFAILYFLKEQEPRTIKK